MKYKGMELKEFTSDKPVVFDPPKKMLVWCKGELVPNEEEVLAFFPGRSYPVILKDDSYLACAEIPGQPKPRRATNRELAKWLAQGKGMLKTSRGASIYTSLSGLEEDRLADRCSDELVVRKWDDDEWHEPTVDYMGLEE